MTGSGRDQTVLVLGGGIGGVVTANRLRKRLDSRHRVVLVSREAEFSFAASYLWVMTGARRPEQVTRPLQRLNRRGIEVVIGAVEEIDPMTRTVNVAGRDFNADHLVVSLGADWATHRVPGLAEHGHTFATLDGAERLARELAFITSGQITVVTAAPLYKCPAAPYEAALLIDAGLRARGIRDRVKVAIRSAEAAPMPVAGANISAAVVQILTERGIDYQPSRQITGAEPGLIHFGDAAENTDLLVYMPPIVAPAVIANSALAADDGWIHADPQTLATGFDGVYSIGDNTQILLKIGKPLPRAGVFAHGQARAVAERISAVIAGEPEVAQFDGHGGCFIETGAGRAAYGVGNFYADPAPTVTMHKPARRWHWGKAAFEFDVLRRWL
ncbi:MAG: FAD/NAD(P)-binding oxidoreductase [Candidatus Nanopelagicaceae bacterium]|nr:FAD/NAD(P)-binding oxidoreductase [Candidatus Nanopelagicaceae bacterium]